jgi:hypothetical protein
MFSHINSEGEHIYRYLYQAKQNIDLNTRDPVAQGGFTQVPNFILSNPNLSVGAKVVYAMFLSYAWHNDLVFPGQDRLAKDMGLTRPRVTQLTDELRKAGLIEITRRGQGKTNLYKVNFVVQKKPQKNKERESR